MREYKIDPLEHLNLINAVLRDLGVPNHIYDDMAQEGYFGLDHAAKNFNGDMKTWGSYAYGCIRGKILHAINSGGHHDLVRKPVYKRNQEVKIRKTIANINRLRRKNKQPPISTQEAARVLSINISDVEAIIHDKVSYRIDLQRLSNIHEGNPDANRVYQEIAKGTVVADRYADDLYYEQLVDTIKTMADSDNDVRAFCLYVIDGIPFTQVGRIMNCTHEWARQTALQGAAKIRQRLAEDYELVFNQKAPIDNPLLPKKKT